MKLITLTQGKFAKVDDADFDWLNRWKWYANKSGHTFYVIRTARHQNGKRYPIRLHRQILNLERDDPRHVDHIDGDGLNNQRKNLRIVSHLENSLNRRSNENSSSRYKGVIWEKSRRRWKARITINGHLIHLGRFSDEVKAAKAYDAAAIRHFGKLAKLNFHEEKK